MLHTRSHIWLLVAGLVCVVIPSFTYATETQLPPAPRVEKVWDHYTDSQKCLYRIAAYGAGLFAVVCICVSFCGKTKNRATIKAALLAIWTIGIPVWFWYDMHYLLQDDVKTNSEMMKQYKEERDTGEKVWLAVATVLTGLYFGEYLKRSSKEDASEQG